MVTTELFDIGITRTEPSRLLKETVDFVETQYAKARDPNNDRTSMNLFPYKSLKERVDMVVELLQIDEQPVSEKKSNSYTALEALNQNKPDIEVYRIKRVVSELCYGGSGVSPVAVQEALFATDKDGDKKWRVVQITDWKEHNGESRRFRIDKLLGQAEAQYSEVK
ncbi:MAG: hypothetical protein GOU99_01510 [Candidatus Altiarchaeota archaeon]|nr:hypothetical protein [Candidatus Altiarchaeota archaeon]